MQDKLSLDRVGAVLQNSNTTMEPLEAQSKGGHTSCKRFLGAGALLLLFFFVYTISGMIRGPLQDGASLNRVGPVVRRKVGATLCIFVSDVVLQSHLIVSVKPDCERVILRRSETQCSFMDRTTFGLRGRSSFSLTSFILLSFFFSFSSLFTFATEPSSASSNQPDGTVQAFYPVSSEHS